MASEKILNEKKLVVSEIVDNIKNSESVILFQYQGLTVAEMSELRNQLKEVNSTVKIYKNTLLKRALENPKFDIKVCLFFTTVLNPHSSLNLLINLFKVNFNSLSRIKCNI